jgi:signal transduction histidine kinase
LDPHLPEISINYEEIKQAFLNLVKNSLESMPDGGELIIETSLKTTAQGEFISIVFSDRGSGIRREDLKHLFRPFFTTKVRGSGLGLAICYRIIVERHKGKLNIESEEGKGTKIIVELPIHPGRDIHGEKSS